MENSSKGMLRITLAILAVLLFGMLMGGLITTVGAQETQDVAVIELTAGNNYIFTPEGYKVGNNETVPHTGAYFLYGNGSQDVTFKSNNGEAITYDVTVHNLDANSSEWCASLGVHSGVTLNLTVQGENRFYGHNHSGVVLGEEYEGAPNPVVNLILEENSSIGFGYTWEDHPGHAIDSRVTININEGTVCSVDMSDENWYQERYIDFTNGTGTAHKPCYYIDDEACGRGCEDCTVIASETVAHEKVALVLGQTDPDVEAKHEIVCKNCSHVFERPAHNLEYEYLNEETHGSKCKDCGYVSSTAETEHSVDETNTCTGCGKSYAVSYTVNNETKNYFYFESIIESLAANGGTVKLLKDTDINSRLLIGANYDTTVDITVDLNGFTLIGARISHSGKGKVTIIDTSEGKTGEFHNNTGVASSNSYGTVEYNGITMSNNSMSADLGPVIFRDVTIKDYVTHIYIREESAKVELINVKAEKGVTLYFEDISSYNEIISISGGEFSSIELNCSSYQGNEELYLVDTLAQGYAFANDDGIVNGYTRIMTNVKVVEHSEHTYDVYSDLGINHIVSCICGLSEEGVTSELHSLGQDGLCVCGVQIYAVVNDEIYFGRVSSALSYADSLGGATVKLTQDARLEATTMYSNIILDLNGFKLDITDFVTVSGNLTINDSSEEATGYISAESNNHYLFDVESAGLVINGGELYGTIGLSDYHYIASSLEINGGYFPDRFYISIYKGANVVINGGYFENSKSLIYVRDTGIAPSIVINGGTFVNVNLMNSNGLDPQTILGTVEGCELGYLDVYGNEVTLVKDQKYEGVITVAHKNSTLIGSENGHSFYCETCDVTIGLVDHCDPEYTADENDATKHIVSCEACGYELGKEDHTGGAATCTEPASCEICEEPYGEALGHSWVNADCITPKTCSVCGETEGEALGHTWVDADCVTPKTCSVCDETEGEALGHTWVDADCVTPKTCSVCDETEGEALGHSWVNASCTTAKTCSVCKKTEGKALGHSYGEDEKCTVCGEAGPNYKEGLSTGAIVGIVIGSVAVAGGIGVGAWFILKKKGILNK